MSFPLWATHVTAALSLFTLVASTVACTFATIAAVGFRGTDWGYAIAPLPVVFAAMTVSTAVGFHPMIQHEESLLPVALWAVAIVAIGLSGWRFAVLMTGRRKVMG